VSDNTADLEARIEQLEDQVTKLRQELLQSQLDEWKSRIDQLDVQMHLGSMNLRDELSPVLERLRNGYLEARAQLDQTQSTVGEALGSLLDAAKAAVKDLSKGWDEAIDRLTSRSDTSGES